MGLDARVYRSKKSLPANVEAMGAKRDSRSGEYYFESAELERQVSPKIFVAEHKRIGNASAVAELRNELTAVVGHKYSLLLERCLSTGTHSGDVIEYELLDQLETEISQVLSKLKPGERPLLQGFLDDMSQLLSVAKREKNPIVFV